MKKIIFLITVYIALILFGSFQVAADSFMPPEPFEIWSDDGTIVFRWNPGDSYNWTFGAQASVYLNGELLYSVENLPMLGEWAQNFFFSQDFIHFIHAPTTGHEVALRFYSYGELVKTYYIADLVRDMRKVTRSETMAMWTGIIGDSRSWFEHILEHDILRVQTVDGILYEFDLTTGVILNSVGGENSFAWLRYGLFITAGVFIVGIITIVVIKRNCKRYIQPSRQ